MGGAGVVCWLLLQRDGVFQLSRPRGCRARGGYCSLPRGSGDATPDPVLPFFPLGLVKVTMVRM
jgi:hypothetical protein